MHEILLNVESKEIRYAYLKHGQLHDLIFDRKKSRQITGNIYRGQGDQHPPQHPIGLHRYQ